MNSIEKIEQLFSQISPNNNNLSSILPQLYPIALECKDYKGFYTLFLWGISISQDGKTTFISHCKEACEMLKDSGIDEQKISVIEKVAKEQYLTLRGYDGKKQEMLLLSAKQMEEQIIYIDKLLKDIEDTVNKNTIEPIVRSGFNSKYNEFISIRQNVQDQYLILHDFILNKLAKYKNLISASLNIKQNNKCFQNSKKIFIIHGHNEAKRRELESLLKDKFNLIPIVLSEQPNNGLTIIEKFEKYASECSYAFAIFTPDDIVTKSEDEQYFQARPNVIFELGWFYATLGRSRVSIVEQESDKSKIFSDLQGIMRLQFKEQVEERYLDIEKELKSVGII